MLELVLVGMKGYDMSKNEILLKLLEKFDSSKSQESRFEDSPSKGDVVATQFMRKFEDDQRKQAKRNWGVVFEG